VPSSKKFICLRVTHSSFCLSLLLYPSSSVRNQPFQEQCEAMKCLLGSLCRCLMLFSQLWLHVLAPFRISALYLVMVSCQSRQGLYQSHRTSQTQFLVQQSYRPVSGRSRLWDSTCLHLHRPQVAVRHQVSALPLALVQSPCPVPLSHRHQLQNTL
jgi:hypothetical protein